eukprot:SAG11_NODE_12286_length_711_cov_0.529412_1_plen_74_part_10
MSWPVAASTLLQRWLTEARVQPASCMMWVHSRRQGCPASQSCHQPSYHRLTTLRDSLGSQRLALLSSRTRFPIR